MAAKQLPAASSRGRAPGPRRRGSELASSLLRLLALALALEAHGGAAAHVHLAQATAGAAEVRGALAVAQATKPSEKVPPDEEDCRDYVPPGQERWIDPLDNACEWYFMAPLCWMPSSLRFNRTAEEACCSCGGGVRPDQPDTSTMGYATYPDAKPCGRGMGVRMNECSRAAAWLGFGPRVKFIFNNWAPDGCWFDKILAQVSFNSHHGWNRSLFEGGAYRYISICRTAAKATCPDDDGEMSLLCRVLVSLGAPAASADCGHLGIHCVDGVVYGITWGGRQGLGSRVLSWEISKLKHLSELALMDPLLTMNISSLGPLQSMRALEISGVDVIGDMRSIGSLVRLELLKLLRLTAKADLSFLSSLHKLKVLTLMGNQNLRCSLADFVGKHDLVSIEISDTMADGDISYLQNLVNVRTLLLTNVSVFGDLRYLQNMTSLRSLHLVDTRVRGDLRVLGGFVQLTFLIIRKHHLLSGHLADVVLNANRTKSMTTVFLTGMRLSGDLACLSTHSDLAHLDLTNTSVTGGLEALTPLRGLRRLSLGHTKVYGDISSLRQNSALQTLDLSFTQVSGDIDNGMAYAFPAMTSLILERINVRFTLDLLAYSADTSPFGGLEILNLAGCSLNMSVWDLLSIFGMSARLSNIGAANASIHGPMVNLETMALMTQQGEFVDRIPLAQSLVFLDLRGNLITHATVPAASLQVLDVSDNAALSSVDDDVLIRPYLHVDLRSTSVQRDDLFHKGLLKSPDERMFTSTISSREGVLCLGIPGRLELQVTPETFAPESLCRCARGYERRLVGVPPNVHIRCMPCKPGSHSSNPAMSCVECPPGQVAQQNRSVECQACDPGSFASLPGQTACSECPGGTYSDKEGQPECQLCPWFAPDSKERKTGYTINWLSLVIFVNLTSVICIVQLFAPRYRKSIEDLSEDNGKWMLVTAGRHWLRTLSKDRTIRVQIGQTGHPILDGGGSSGYHAVRIVSSRSLELVDPEHDLNLDTSSGVIHLSFIQTIWYCGFRCFNLGSVIAVEVICLFLAHCAMSVWRTWKLIFVASLLTGGVLGQLARPWLLGSSSISIRVDQYRGELLRSNPAPSSCSPGPSRAVNAAKIVDFYAAFQGYIRERNMYYVNCNILLPLTQPHRLSFAELAGPSPVKWFVSHYWGHSLRHFVDSIRSHAEIAACSGGFCWQEESYWICSLSNNQHRLKEELGVTSQAAPGETWKHSSFYLALQSQSCQGTAMVLDENVQPLTRSWCLFEVLQTFKRTQNSDGDALWEGLHFCTSTGVLNHGGGSVDLAIAIARRLASLRLEEASASEVADKDMIDNLVLQEGGFEKMNFFVRENICGVIREVELCLRNDFDKLKTALEGRHQRKTKLDPGRLTDPRLGSKDGALRWKLAELGERLAEQEARIALQQEQLSRRARREATLVQELEKRGQELSDLRNRTSLRSSMWSRVRGISRPLGDVELAETGG